jgi:hypothetical protein
MPVQQDARWKNEGVAPWYPLKPPTFSDLNGMRGFLS